METGRAAALGIVTTIKICGLTKSQYPARARQTSWQIRWGHLHLRLALEIVVQCPL